MELEAAKMIGAGLAAIALAGAGVGIGIIFGNYLSGAMRNPKFRIQLRHTSAISRKNFLIQKEIKKYYSKKYFFNHQN